MSKKSKPRKPAPAAAVEQLVEAAVTEAVLAEPAVEEAAPPAVEERKPVFAAAPPAADAAARFEQLTADVSIPAERKKGTAENARWFLRKGWIFCTGSVHLDELRRLAQQLA